MNMTAVTAKGQIVIPVRIRRKLNIKKGTRLMIEEKDDMLILKPLTKEYFTKVAGVLPTKGALARSLIAERKKEREKEG